MQQPASATTALIEQDKSTSRRQPPEEQASQHQYVSSNKQQEGTALIFQSLLEKASTLEEIALVVNSDEDARESQAAMKDAQLHAYFDDDLTLYSAEDSEKAQQKEGERLKGTHDPVSRSSLTAQQLKHVTQTTWAIQPRASQGEASLTARIVDISELQQDPDVLWQLTQALYGIKTDLKHWQQSLTSKLEEIGLRKNKVEPCIFTSEQLIVMHHQDALLIVGDQHQQESFLSQLSASIPLTDTTKLDAKTQLTFLNTTLEHNHQEHGISLHLPVLYYMKLFKMYGIESDTPTCTLEEQLCPSKGQRRLLASARKKLYKTAVGHLLWATSVRPDISFAVQELSRSLQAPTQQDEKKAAPASAQISQRNFALHDQLTTSTEESDRSSFERAYTRLLLSFRRKHPEEEANKWSYPLLVGSSFGSFQQHTSFLNNFSRSRTLCNGNGCPS